MDSTIAKLVFEFAGSNANILNNLIGHSMSIDNKKCGKGSGTDSTFNLAVVGAEIISGGSSLISELDATDIGDKFEGSVLKKVLNLNSVFLTFTPMTSIDVGKANPMANSTIIAFNGLGMLFAYPPFIGICKNSIEGLPMITRNTVIGNVLLF